MVIKRSTCLLPDAWSKMGADPTIRPSSGVGQDTSPKIIGGLTIGTIRLNPAIPAKMYSLVTARQNIRPYHCVPVHREQGHPCPDLPGKRITRSISCRMVCFSKGQSSLFKTGFEVLTNFLGLWKDPIDVVEKTV